MCIASLAKRGKRPQLPQCSPVTVVAPRNDLVLPLLLLPDHSANTPSALLVLSSQRPCTEQIYLRTGSTLHTVGDGAHRLLTLVWGNILAPSANIRSPISGNQTLEDGDCPLPSLCPQQCSSK